MKLYLTPLLFTFASAEVPSLTPENWAEMTRGKSAFIKFFTPECHNCKEISADWEKLAEKWDGSDVGIVAEVDCTVNANGPICGNVQGYPTIRYGDPSSLEDYKGGIKYDEFANFADENLKPICSLASLENCTEDEKAELAKFDKLSRGELLTRVNNINEAVKDIKAAFEDVVDDLEDEYEDLIEEVETKTINLKEEKLYKLMKVVLALKNVPAVGSDEL